MQGYSNLSFLNKGFPRKGETYLQRVKAFARVLDGKAVVAVLNNGDTPAQLEFQLPVETAKVTDLLADTVGAQEVLVSTEWNRMKVQLPSNYATLLRVE